MAQVHRRVGDHVVDGLLPAPAERVHPGVDDQPARAHRVGGQHAHPVERRGVQPHLVGQPLGVEPPALAVRRDEQPLAELGDVLELAGDAELQVVARDALVVAGVLDLEAAPALGVGDVHEEDAAAGAVLGRREVVGDRAAGGPLDVAVGLREPAEPVAHRGPGLGHRGLGVGDDGGAVPVVQRRVLAQRPVDRRHVGGADHLRAEGGVLLLQAGHLLQADLVDLLGAGVDGRVEPRQPRVDVVAVGQVRQAAPLVGSGVRGDLVAEHVAVLLHRGPDLLLHHRAQPLAPGVRVDTGGRVLHGQHRVVADRRGQPRVELRDGLGDRERGGRPPGRDALAVPLRHAPEVARDALELADHRLRDLGCRQRQLGDVDVERGLHPEDRVRAELLGAAVEQLGARGRVPSHDGPGDAPLVVERVRVDRLGARRQGPGLRGLALLRGPADVVEPVGVAVLADHVRPGRRRAELEVLVVLGEPVELGGRVWRLVCCRVRHEGHPRTAARGPGGAESSA